MRYATVHKGKCGDTIWPDTNVALCIPSRAGDILVNAKQPFGLVQLQHRVLITT